ncbi:hypothetical protein J4G37_50590, partial [Microvirga sp. 3-52]|nr:hypothetical protein [Microvirga sp. 3-52]
MGLGDGFWGALLGATVTGFMAIWISNGEQNKRTKEKADESKKVLLLLKEYSSGLINEITKMVESINLIKETDDPYAEVEVDYVDNEGNQYYKNLPTDPDLDKYDSIVRPYKGNLKESNEKIL